MPISVRDVLQMESLERARIVAGEAGLDREVRWITVGEEPDLPDWVFRGRVDPEHALCRGGREAR